ncbi:D-galactarolactone cycloisomerase [Abditibacteriota bacterium]|nr:D-galactarolactone cycloisomerase [Abditibacteriota bacterium]
MASKERVTPIRRDLRIDRLLIQRAVGERLSPVAPNAYAPYRGYHNEDRIFRVRAGEFEGIGHGFYNPDEKALSQLLGINPFDLFAWGEGDIILGPAEQYAVFFDEQRWCDVALLDILGQVLKRPIHQLLGAQVREKVQIYDSSLYMEDLLTLEQQHDLIYLRGKAPTDPGELVARKAEWLLGRPEGFTMLKLKTGRAKWLPSFEAALERDIAVTRAVRKAIGNQTTLLVDTNKGYAERPLASLDYMAAAGDVFLLEEPFPETDVENLKKVKRRLRASGNSALLAAGESFYGGIPKDVCGERLLFNDHEEPLVDVEQADMNQNGLLGLMKIVRERRVMGMTIAPHNFGSKLGFYAQIHLGLITPNWLFAEVDDSQVPALKAHGISISHGQASLTGEPGLGVTLDESKLEAPSLHLEL